MAAVRTLKSPRFGSVSYICISFLFVLDTGPRVTSLQHSRGVLNSGFGLSGQTCDMASQILVPVDGSPLSVHALSVALAENPDAEIHALHVVDPTEPGYSYLSFETEPYDLPQHGSEAWYDRAEEHAEDVFEAASEQASEYDVEIHTETRVGRPGREIVRYIEDEGVDHVILGSHGRDEESRSLVGSVAEAVVFRSPVRVTLVK